MFRLSKTGAEQDAADWLTVNTFVPALRVPPSTVIVSVSGVAMLSLSGTL
jgi:uncharacterized membrane protein YqhA